MTDAALNTFPLSDSTRLILAELYPPELPPWKSVAPPGRVPDGGGLLR